MNVILSNWRQIGTHIIVWALLLLLPYVIIYRNDIEISFGSYITVNGFGLITYMISFYLTYFLIVPNTLMKGGYGFRYVVSIIVLAILCGITTFILDDLFKDLVLTPHRNPNMNEVNDFPRFPPWAVIMRDSFSYLLVAIIATVSKFSSRWKDIQQAKQETEKALAEAELQSLKSQMNPHFLLNTLNNIYALIAIDGAKAQETVHELSKMLRHVLYDNQSQFTTMEREVEFMHSYIELMRIRLASNVRLETNFEVPEGSQTQIAPLIVISLIENAFKHGISSTESSFINIHIKEEPHQVTFDIRNSFYPKGRNDKSGNGIGLQQVQRRLDLSYPGKYEWTKGLTDDGKEYFSKIVIHID